MNKQQKIELNNLLTKYNKRSTYGEMDFDTFIINAKRYIKATNESRMMCSIDKVSASGMSRTLKFIEMAKANKTSHHNILNFYVLFDVLGYQKVSNSDYFRISGCGMDMVFATNYAIINELQSLGLISKAKADILAQRTPHLI